MNPNSSSVLDRLRNIPDKPVQIQVAPVEVEVPVPYPTLALADDGSIPAHNFQISGLGLVMYEEATEADWADVGNALFKLEGAMQMAIGDWLNCGEKFGRSIEWIAGQLNRDVKTLKNWSRVASKFPETLRRETMFYGHYSLLAAKTNEVKEKAVNLQSENQWTVVQLREYLTTVYKGRMVKRKRPIDRCLAELGKTFNRAKKLPYESRLEIAQYLRQQADSLDNPHA